MKLKGGLTAQAALVVCGALLGLNVVGVRHLMMVGVALLGTQALRKDEQRELCLIVMLALPWQYVNGVNANPVLNPFMPFALIWVATGKRDDVGRPWRALGLLVLLFPAILQLTSALVNGVEARSMLTWCLPYMALVLALAARPPRQDRLLRAIVAVAAVVSAMVVLEGLLGKGLLSRVVASDIIARDYLAIQASRALGPLGNPLATGTFLAASLGYTIRAPIKRAWAIGLSGLAVLAILFTGSRSAILAAVVVLVLVGVSRCSGRDVIRIAVLCGCVAVALHASVPALRFTAVRLAGWSSLTSSERDRAFSAGFVIDEIKRHPLAGQPVGRVVIEKQALTPVASGAKYGIESSWLALMGDQGVLGVSVLMAALAGAIWRRRSDPAVMASASVVVSLWFWNGWLGVWTTNALAALVLTLALAVPEPIRVEVAWRA